MTELPAEWAPQAALLLTWPHSEQDWEDDFENVERCFSEIALQTAAFQPVIISTPDRAGAAEIKSRLVKAGTPEAQVRIYPEIPSNDVWARDHGPITVFRDGAPILLDFRFDGWGGKYPADEDNRISLRLHAAGAFAECELESLNLTLEGGSIDTDGCGSLLTTTSCLLESARNPGIDRKEYERLFKRHLGIERVLWLENGALEGDDTDGHIDTLVRFAPADTLVYQGSEDKHDRHYPGLTAMADELRRLRTAKGAPYRLVELPLPKPVYAPNGRRLPAGYANFTIINGAVLMPTYADPADEQAGSILQGLFPGRRLIPIDCRALVRQNGSLHCVTMQLPAQPS